MMNLTNDSENNHNSINTSEKLNQTGPKDPPKEVKIQHDSQKEDTSQMSNKSDDMNKMTNKDTTPTSPNNPF